MPEPKAAPSAPSTRPSFKLTHRRASHPFEFRVNLHRNDEVVEQLLNFCEPAPAIPGLRQFGEHHLPCRAASGRATPCSTANFRKILTKSGIRWSYLGPLPNRIGYNRLTSAFMCWIGQWEACESPPCRCTPNRG